MNRIPRLIGENETISGLRRSDHNLTDPELNGRLDNVVRSDGVDPENFVIRRNHDARNGSEMENVIKDLAAIRYVRDEGSELGVGQRLGIKVENLVTPLN